MRALVLTCLVVTATAFLFSCAHGNRALEIPVQSLSSGGPDAFVHVDVPADWRPLPPSPARAEFLAPDNRSRAYVRAMPAAPDIKRCPAVARQYASEFIEAWGGPPRTRVASKIASGEKVDFELRRVDPKPDGEVIWARVLCSNGALAVASCTVPMPREAQLRSQCRDILESLRVVASPKPSADRSYGSGGMPSEHAAANSSPRLEPVTDLLPHSR